MEILGDSNNFQKPPSWRLLDKIKTRMYASEVSEHHEIVIDKHRKWHLMKVFPLPGVHPLLFLRLVGVP